MAAPCERAHAQKQTVSAQSTVKNEVNEHTAQQPVSSVGRWMKVQGMFKMQTHSPISLCTQSTLSVQRGDGTLHASVRFGTRTYVVLPQHTANSEHNQWGDGGNVWAKGSKRQTLCTKDEDPPVMSNPISSAVPPDCISKTRLAPMALSTTLPGTCASMVRARSMQIAELEYESEHMSL